MKKYLNKKVVSIIALLIILIPNLIKFNNEYTNIKINKETYNLYNTANQLLNDNRQEFNNLCLIDEKSEKKYMLNEKYKNNKDYDLINDFLCEQLSEYTSPIELISLKKEEKFYFKNITHFPKSIFHERSFENLKYTEYEIVYNYIITINNIKNKNDFYNPYKNNNIYKINFKLKMQENYEKQIKYEIEQLKAINNIIKYFEYKLENT